MSLIRVYCTVCDYSVLCPEKVKVQAEQLIAKHQAKMQCIMKESK